MRDIIAEIIEFVSQIIEQMGKIHMTLIAAGVAFYGMFAIFPGMAAIVALWGYWWDDPAVILNTMAIADEFLPDMAQDIIHTQMNTLLSAPRGQLGWASLFSIGIALFSARAGVNGLIQGLNAAHSVRPHNTIRGFVLAIGLTLALVGVVLLGLITIVLVPLLLNLLPLTPLNNTLVAVLPWLVMFLIVVLGIGILYRYGPNLKVPRTPFLTWGALFAAVAWAAASVGFSFYLSSFANYNRFYGSIGAVIALLMWFYLASFAIMLGALINIEIAHRRRIWAAKAARQIEPTE